MYEIKKIKYKNWAEYEKQVNKLYLDGWEIDETLSIKSFSLGLGEECTCRMKKIK